MAQDTEEKHCLICLTITYLNPLILHFCFSKIQIENVSDYPTHSERLKVEQTVVSCCVSKRLIHKHYNNSDVQGQGIRTSCQHTHGISTTSPAV